jgi:hypothetical protein
MKGEIKANFADRLSELIQGIQKGLFDRNKTKMLPKIARLAVASCAIGLLGFVTSRAVCGAGVGSMH